MSLGELFVSLWHHPRKRHAHTDEEWRPIFERLQQLLHPVGESSHDPPPEHYRCHPANDDESNRLATTLRQKAGKEVSYVTLISSAAVDDAEYMEEPETGG